VDGQPLPYGALDEDDWPLVGIVLRRNLPNIVMPVDDVHAICNLVSILTLVAVNAMDTMRVPPGGGVLIILTYELFGWEDINVLLSKSVRIQNTLAIADNDWENTVKWAIHQMIAQINVQAMHDRYSENGINNFYIRGIRCVSTGWAPQHAVLPGGQFYNRPPNNWRVPRGGCMTHASLGKKLMEVLGDDTIVSTDRPVANHLFDNNCGIREIIDQATEVRIKNAASVYMQAAWMRESMRTIPPFVRLTPSDLHAICERHFPDHKVLIYILPSPFCKYMGRPNLRTIVQMQIGAANRKDIHIAYMDNHYWKVTDVEKCKKMSWCPRCVRYYERGNSRVTHYSGIERLDVPTDWFPLCSVRQGNNGRWENWLADAKRGGHTNENAVPIDVDEDESKLLKQVHPLTHLHQLTSLEHIGVMDFETWRPTDNNGYHKVYAAGWIPHCSAKIKPADVKLYNSFENGEESNDGLDSSGRTVVRVMSELIEMMTKSGKYDRKNPYYLFFFYGSGFDVMFILNTLSTEMRLNPDSLLLHNGKPLSVSYLEGALVIRDLQLFTLGSLKKCCEMYKIDKRLTKGKFDHDKIVVESDIELHWEEIAVYLRKDLTSLNMVLINKLNEVFDTLKLDMCKRVTASHLAFDYWCSTLTEQMRACVVLPATYDEYIEILKSYYGGRVMPCVEAWCSSQWELAKVGKLTYDQLKDFLTLLDVVSLYPSSMMFSEAVSKAFMLNERNMPKYFCGKPEIYEPEGNDPLCVTLLTYPPRETRMHSKVKVPAILYNRRWCESNKFDNETQGCIVCVDVEPNPNITVPILPHKTAKGGTAWDLRPHKNQYYVIDEILDALYYGYKVTKVHRVMMYPHREALFDISVAKLSGMKIARAAIDENDPGIPGIKLALNGAYGKMAQKIVEHVMKILYAEEIDGALSNNLLMNIEMLCKTGKLTTIDEDGNEEVSYAVQSCLATFKSADCMPTKPTYIGAQVTAYSRIHMNFCMYELDILFNTTNIEGQLFYTDTDSILVHMRNIARMIAEGKGGMFGKALGQLSDDLKGGRVLRHVALAPKTYAELFMMPNNKLYCKIRCKGIPHTDQPIEVGVDNLPIVEGNPHWPEWMSRGANRHILQEKLQLGQSAYCVEYKDGSPNDYMTKLNFDVFDGVSSGRVSNVTVYFTTMKRRLFGHNTNNEISGIQHVSMHRSLGTNSWWNGTAEGSVEPKNRERLPGQPRVGGISVPINHILTMSM
jgi:hypothetical protein